MKLKRQMVNFMTKLFINTQALKNNVLSSLTTTDTQLRVAYTYCNYLVIPENYVNLNYLKGCGDRLKSIKSELNDVTQNLNDLINRLERFDDNICIDISNINYTDIKERKGIIN